MLYATAHEYNLTFRCINCGRYEASANYSSVVGRAKLAALPRFECYAVKERGLMKCSVIAAIRENCTQEP